MEVIDFKQKNGKHTNQGYKLTKITDGQDYIFIISKEKFISIFLGPE